MRTLPADFYGAASATPERAQGPNATHTPGKLDHHVPALRCYQPVQHGRAPEVRTLRSSL